ncbi:VPS35 endosomal protein-sorting factor-like isoform X2 [Oncorhynchus keta]|uniref:VPS35 endosomal protein-sorting factor-like isoform X2 n=1 Tax=Oncorhynchus keta TaxID=8018 RepID=UPI0015FAC54B|nr:VPS35 endosomal protein-sorting factor-like isoform X2 [Oncorhynchus keta]
MWTVDSKESSGQKREVNTVLSDIIKHIMPDRAFEDAYAQLQSVIRKILTYFHDFSILFSMERFLPFVDMSQKDSVRVEVCLSIMDIFINALTLEDEKRSGLTDQWLHMHGCEPAGRGDKPGEEGEPLP